MGTFSRLKIVNEPPSRISKPQSYQSLQKKAQQRILDDRPCVDRFIPPISLLYDGFGVFHDVIHERCKVSGEDSIHEAKLWNKVNAFADRMAEFYEAEAARRDIVLNHLDEIFRARRDTVAEGWNIKASRIGSRQITSDGHLDGAHGAMVFCIECKNELSGISCEPSAELVSYIASSFNERLKGKDRALFHMWRVPALGMTQIGECRSCAPCLHPLTGCLGAFVQFLGVVMLAPHIRVVPLTPMLPLATPINDEGSRHRVFLAFKAASIVLAKIQADVSKFVQESRPEIPLALREFPSVTGIKADPQLSSPPLRIDFTLLRRYDTEVDYRHLYHAQVASTKEEIYVKFTPRYSPELHRFCANKGFAPKLLGFEQLSGGWFAVAMEKVDVVDPREIESFSELDDWREGIWKLVSSFHQQNLVHGDLRLANFIFTKESPRRMLLVDFDWGGGVGNVYFPRGELTEELCVKDDEGDCLDRLITVGDDDRVLAMTFEKLERIATERGWTRKDIDTDSIGNI